MKLSRAVSEYVRWKQSRGVRFEKVYGILRRLLRLTNDVSLIEITPKQVSALLDGSKMAADTWWRAYQDLRSFFQFWISRGRLRKLPMPRPRAALPPPFHPFVYSTSELSRLIKCIELNHDSKARQLDNLTLKTIVLILYGTGALVSEVLNLRCSDVDLNADLLTLRRITSGNARTVSIGCAVHNCFHTYLSAHPNRTGSKEFVFLNRRGNRVPTLTLVHNFRLLCIRAKLCQEHGISRTPGMHDLRHTFAVHCLDRWLAQGKDLRTMLPILSAYMGHVMWRSTEQYLRLVPGRFWKQLSRLGSIGIGAESSVKPRTAWSKIQP